MSELSPDDPAQLGDAPIGIYLLLRHDGRRLLLRLTGDADGDDPEPGDIYLLAPPQLRPATA